MCPSTHAITMCYATENAIYRLAANHIFHVQCVAVQRAVMCTVNVPKLQLDRYDLGLASHLILKNWVLPCHLHMQSMCVCSQVFGCNRDRHSISLCMCHCITDVIISLSNGWCCGCGCCCCCGCCSCCGCVCGCCYCCCCVCCCGCGCVAVACLLAVMLPVLWLLLVHVCLLGLVGFCCVWCGWFLKVAWICCCVFASTPRTPSHQDTLPNGQLKKLHHLLLHVLSLLCLFDNCVLWCGACLVLLVHVVVW